MAAAAAEVDAIDTINAHFRDLDGLAGSAGRQGATASSARWRSIRRRWRSSTRPLRRPTPRLPRPARWWPPSRNRRGSAWSGSTARCSTGRICAGGTAAGAGGVRSEQPVSSAGTSIRSGVSVICRIAHAHGIPPMKSWPIQDAEARFGEILDTCLKEGPQLVMARARTRHSWCRSTGGTASRGDLGRP